MSAQRRLDWAEVRRQGGGFQTGSRGQHFRSQSPALLLRFRSAAPSSTPASGSKNRGGQRDAVPTGPPSKDHQGRQGLGTDGGLSQRPAPRTRPMRHLLPGRKLKPALATQSPASNWPGLRRGVGCGPGQCGDPRQVGTGASIREVLSKLGACAASPLRTEDCTGQVATKPDPLPACRHLRPHPWSSGWEGQVPVVR